MGMSSSKTKTTQTNDPYAAAKPAIDAGLAQVQSINQTAQPRIDAISQSLADGFNSVAPRAFGANSFVAGAQDQAANIAAGANVGANPGAALYAQLMGGGNDPSMSILSQLAQGSRSPGQYDGIGSSNPALAALSGLSDGGTNSARAGLAAMGYGGAGITAQDVHASNKPNLGDAFAARSASGTYLGAQPSGGFYADTLGGKYLNANPYLDAMVKQSTDSATKAANARFAAAGMGEGVSTPYAQALGSSIANAENALRYGAYKDELTRMGQIAGQSDAAFGNERQQMSTANALLSANANARADRALDAAKTAAANRLAADTSNATLSLNALGKLSDADIQKFSNALSASSSLGNLYNQTGQLNLSAQQAKDAAFSSDRAAQLAGASALGNQHTAGQQTQLAAARSADDAYQAQQAQIMQALGMVPALDAATYNGIPAALQAASAASTLPYSGTGAYADIINALAGKYGTQTSVTKSTPSAFDQVMKGVSLAGSLATGFGGTGAMSGGLGAGLQSGILNAAPLPGIGSVDLSSLTAPRF